jgi:hypothetical protein
MRKQNSAAVIAALARGPPDLQALVEAHEHYSNIPNATWIKYDEALQECQRLLRAKHIIIGGHDYATQGNLFSLTWT